MSDKPKNSADLVFDTVAAEHAVERFPSAVGEISALASAHAPVIYFEVIEFSAVNAGIAGLTLSTSRQMAHLPGGKVGSDRMIVAHLRASLPAMLAMRAMIDGIEKMAQRQSEAAAAAAEAEIETTRLPN